MRSHNSTLISKTFHPSPPISRFRYRSSALCALLARVSLDSGTFNGLKSYAYLKVINHLHKRGLLNFVLMPGLVLGQELGDMGFCCGTRLFMLMLWMRSIYGILNNFGILAFLIAMFSLVDWCAWRIVRLPLPPFYLIRPFAISIAMVCFVGYICVPLLRSLKLLSIIRNGPARHSYKSGTPTMGGLYFIPIGIIVAEVIVGFSSIEVSGAAAVTLVFAAIGLVDDLLSLKNNNNGLSAKMRILLEIAATTCFLCWLYTADISSPYSMKMLVPMPAPLGLLCLGNFYPFLTAFCFVSMANGVNFTDGLDGLAGGTAALAFTGMSIAVLPICADLAVFGASMAGACVGFLFHNRYKASIFMGNTGALALGGALAAMAACTGMFFPLFISSGIFFLEVLSVIMQVSFFKTSKHWRGTGYRLFRMAPLHHHLELCGIKEPIIVAGAYVISAVLVFLAGYIGLISA
nr:phospho-N-acetylmuramoyl-pentapeptide-transferase homolog isoform X5 [Coffea arabica]